MSRVTENEHDFLWRVLKEDDHAVSFVEMVGELSQCIDDIRDDPAAVTGYSIEQSFWNAMFSVQSDPFYEAHRGLLYPILMINYIDWVAANTLEKGSLADQRIAFITRDNLAQLVIMCALITGGPQWAMFQAPEIRRFIHDEDFGEYVDEHDQEVPRKGGS